MSKLRVSELKTAAADARNTVKGNKTIAEVKENMKAVSELVKKGKLDPIEKFVKDVKPETPMPVFEYKQNMKAILDDFTRKCPGEDISKSMVDSALENPTTTGGKYFKKKFAELNKKMAKEFNKMQLESGEGGMLLLESKKALLRFLKKYGKTMLILLILGGFGYLFLFMLGRHLTGCYQVFTKSSSSNTPTKVGCEKEQCSCQKDGNTTANQCANPTCDSNEGKNNGVNYYWQDIGPLQALAMLPGMFVSGIASPVDHTLDIIKSIIIYAGIIAGVLGVIFVVYKIYTGKKTEDIVVTPQKVVPPQPVSTPALSVKNIKH